MKQIIADSTTLILLSKCSLLEITCTLFNILVPASVTDETASEDLVRNYPDACIIRDLISRDMIKVAHPDPAELQLPITLHRGEVDALRLALKAADAIYATDDGKAIKAARFLKVPFIISPKIIVDLYRLQKISLKKARKSIEKLGKIGRYSPEIIAESILSLTEARNGETNNNKDTRRPLE